MGWGIALGVILGGALGLSVGAFLSGAALATIAGLAIAPLTAGLVGLTWYLAEETRKARLHNTAPHIIVTLEPHDSYSPLVQVVIENIGNGAAYATSVKFTPDIIYEKNGDERKLSDLPILALPTIKPGQRFVRFVSYFKDIKQGVSEVEVRCFDVNNTLHVSRNMIDLNAFAGSQKLGRDSLLRIADGVEKIRENIDRIVNGSRRLEVNGYTEEDRQREQAEMLAYHREAIEEAAPRISQSDKPKR